MTTVILIHENIYNKFYFRQFLVIVIFEFYIFKRDL
jgi:hypothetical protein